MEGAAFPAIYTCAGQNISPPLGWTGAPAGAKSYAIVLTDTTIQLIHWVLWDIPAAVAATPEGVETKAAPADPAGAIQAKSYDNSTFGYLGPCPSGKLHTYQFALHALDTATLPGVTSASTRAQVEAAILPHSLGKVTLTGTSDASK
jgi:Raf kinase inhibitor-like YbhB/YbcL family protein